MRDEPSLPTGRPRAAADAPVGELADGVAIAKGWLLALLAARPLGAAGELPIAAFAREAPGLAAAVLAALASDAELERLGRGGDLERVAARAGMLAAAGAAAPAAVVAAVDLLRASAWRELMAELRAPDARLVADLAERLAHVCVVVAQAALRAAAPPAAAAAPAEPAPAATHASRAAPAPPGAVLAVEVDDLDRLLAAAPGAGGEDLLARAEAALAGVLGPDDELTCLSPGRYRIAARAVDPAAAHRLADRVGAALAAAATPHSVPLKASIGVAVTGRDGGGADELAAHAEVELFSARAAGT